MLKGIESGYKRGIAMEGDVKCHRGRDRGRLTRLRDERVQGNFTPIFVASQEGHMQVMDRLITAGCNVDQVAMIR